VSLYQLANVEAYPGVVSNVANQPLAQHDGTTMRRFEEGKRKLVTRPD
jgi:hypothetical protein